MVILHNTRPLDATINTLHQRGMFFLAQVIRRWNEVHPIWKMAMEIDLHGNNTLEWNGFMQDLRWVGICRNLRGESLIWSRTPRKGYVVVA